MNQTMMYKLEELLEEYSSDLVIETLKQDVLNLQLFTERYGPKLSESMLEVLGYYMPGREYEDFIRENNLKKND